MSAVTPRWCRSCGTALEPEDVPEAWEAALCLECYIAQGSPRSQPRRAPRPRARAAPKAPAPAAPSRQFARAMLQTFGLTPFDEEPTP